MPTVYALAIREAWADESLVAALNPDRLPPTAESEETWAEPWVHSTLPTEHLPRGWAEGVLTSAHPEPVRAALLTLALAVAARNGEGQPAHESSHGSFAPSSEGIRGTAVRRLWDALTPGNRTELTPPPPENEPTGPGDGRDLTARDIAHMLRSVDPDWAWRRDRFMASGVHDDRGSALTPVSLPMPGGGAVEVPAADWVPSDLGVPTVCPRAALLPPAYLVGGADVLDALEAELVRLGRLAPHRTVHWVGGGGHNCECHLVRPTGREWPVRLTAERELYRATTELLDLLRGHPGEGRRAEVWRLTRRCAELAAAVARPVPAGDWHAPVVWEVARGAAARQMLLGAEAHLESLPPPPVPEPLPESLHLPDGVPAPLVEAYHRLEAALLATWRLRESPDHPTLGFDRCRQDWLAWLQGREESRSDENGEGGWDAVFERTVDALESSIQADRAYRAVELTLAAAGTDGCAFRAALAGLERVASTYEGVLGLAPFDELIHEQEDAVYLGGRAYHVDDTPFVPATDIPAAFLRSPRIPDSVLATCRDQAVRAAKAEQEQTRTAQALKESVKVSGCPQVDKANLRILKFFYENPESIGYSKSKWAEIAMCARQTMEKTEAWKIVQERRAESQLDAVAGHLGRGGPKRKKKAQTGRGGVTDAAG